MIEKATFEYSPLDMSLSKAIKSADDAKKPVKTNSCLRYGSYSFVKFKRDGENFKKISSLDSKNKVINRFLTRLNRFKNLL